jgi:hypothetical protein
VITVCDLIYGLLEEKVTPNLPDMFDNDNLVTERGSRSPFSSLIAPPIIIEQDASSVQLPVGWPEYRWLDGQLLSSTNSSPFKNGVQSYLETRGVADAPREHSITPQFPVDIIHRRQVPKPNLCDNNHAS